MKIRLLGFLSLVAACLAAASTLAAEPAAGDKTFPRAIDLKPPVLRPDDPDSATSLLYQKPKTVTRGMASVSAACSEDAVKAGTCAEAKPKPALEAPLGKDNNPMNGNAGFFFGK